MEPENNPNKPINSPEPTISPDVQEPQAAEPVNSWSAPAATSPAENTAETSPVTETAPPPVAEVAPVQTTVTTGGDDMQTSPKKFPKAAIFGIATLVVVALLGAAYYFGYYTNSKVVYAQSLSNTGKGLTTLTNQFTAQPKMAYKGYTGSGVYKIDSGSFTTDGKITFNSNDDNSDTTFDVGLAASRVNVDIRTIKSASTTPDIYFKASGLSGLGTALGAGAGLDQIANMYDNKWIVIDHTLLDNAQKQLADTSSVMPPTSEQIMDEVNTASKINQEYLFSTSKDKGVTTILKTYGQETVDGHKVIHYQVGFNKPNLKKYITAQDQALLSSKLGGWIKQNNLTAKVDSSYKDALKSVDDIKPNTTFDMYSDINSRLVYKFKFSDEKNPATNYVDVGLDYKNSNELPFFISGTSNKDGDKSDYSLKVTANTDTKAVDVNLSVATSSNSKSKFTSSFSFKPTSVAPVIATPTGALQLAQVMQELGLGRPNSLFSAGSR